MPIKWPTQYSKTTNRRQEWAALKKKHAIALKANQVSFDAQLGSALNKFETAVKQVAMARYGQTASLADLAAVNQAGLKAKAVAHAYQARAAGLSKLAKDELIAFLTAIETDAQVWAEAMPVLPAPLANWPAGGWDSYAGLAGHLTTVRQQGAEALNALADDPRLGTLPELHELHSHLKDLLLAAAAAETAAKHVAGLVDNAPANDALLGELKGAAAQAVAGPFDALQQQIQSLRAFLQANETAASNIHPVAQASGRGLLNNLVLVGDDLDRVAAAEKTLVV